MLLHLKNGGGKPVVIKSRTARGHDRRTSLRSPPLGNIFLRSGVLFSNNRRMTARENMLLEFVHGSNGCIDRTFINIDLGRTKHVPDDVEEIMCPDIA